MLKHLHIKNFKIWRDTGPIRMAPITLFFGANSSGKSSIGHFLMMLKQTVESPDRKAVLFPGGRHSAVQLGSYRELVFGRDPANRISFEYTWSLPDGLRFIEPFSGAMYVGSDLAFAAEVGLRRGGQHTVELDHFRYTLLAHDKAQMLIGMVRKPGEKAEYEVKADQYPLRPKQGTAWSLVAPIRFYGFPDEVRAAHLNAEFVQDLNLQHELLFRSISYLGPIRTRAERLYSWSGVEPENVGYDGENTIPALLAARERMISLGPGKPDKPFDEVIAESLLNMGLIDSFKVGAISEHRQEYEVKVKTKGSGGWVDLPDVGFGVSQVLPVLVQCFYATARSIIVIEQPEVHLHPRAQSALADVMIDVIRAQENGADRAVQLVIETHSEHFLRRLQRRIAESEALHDQVAAYFVNTTEDSAKLEPLQIDPYGFILNWPENFFGEEMEDIAEQARAAMRKRMGERIPREKGKRE